MAGAHRGREVWLAAAVTKLRPFFSSHGFEISDALRVSCGWPSVGGTAPGKRRIGEAWSSTSSRDKHFEIFISPALDKPAEVLAVLVHELVHVAVGLECGHKGRFPMYARSVGLEGRMTATYPSDPLRERLNDLAGKLGKYPHGSLDGMTNGRKKQKARLIRASCLTCTYTIRAAMTWLLIAVPTCPNPDCHSFGKAFDIAFPEDEDG